MTVIVDLAQYARLYGWAAAPSVSDENLSDEENARPWAEEAERRDRAWDANPSIGRVADDVFCDARTRLK